MAMVGGSARMVPYQTHPYKPQLALLLVLNVCINLSTRSLLPSTTQHHDFLLCLLTRYDAALAWRYIHCSSSEGEGCHGQLAVRPECLSIFQRGKGD